MNKKIIYGLGDAICAVRLLPVNGRRPKMVLKGPADHGWF